MPFWFLNENRGELLLISIFFYDAIYALFPCFGARISDNSVMTAE